MPNDETIIFDSRVRKRGGGSHYLLIPKKIRDHLNLENGDKVKIQVETGKYGLYCSFWNPEQQDNEQSESD